MTNLLSYDDAATRLGLKRGTLMALVSQGRIPHLRLGGRLVRFDPDELQRWLAERSVPATAPAPRARRGQAA